MSTPIVEKIPHRKTGKGKDHALIELSWTQLTPGDARPEDFEVLEAEEGVGRETAGHGQHGSSRKEHKALLRKAAGARRW